MAIKIVEDVGAPLAVAGINIASRTVFPAYHDYVVYGMTLLGYGAAWMGWGGNFVKQMGVSSLPLTVDKIYERVRGGTPVSQRLSFKRSGVSRYPAAAPSAPFQGVRLV